ncbi:glycoside hydrolase [Phyllobacterium phragmitis]|uniref:Glycoside hydrolase n=1 Tax=Phyllobacterium phragmitis TaxID=2670329 RepID=A0A2S9IM62_9HYPH|nr:glycosyltransferase family 4 protein [Phyllobacterium phragmitis]PRD41614.1 glycoside hydrolase [Phyllobacterium phragmitis]
MSGSIVVSQLGARMHYAVPRILAGDGRLAHFYTDICATKGWPRLLQALPPRTLPLAIRRLVGRVPHDIPPDRTTTFPSFGLYSAIRRLAGKSRSDETANALWAGERFGTLVAAEGFHDAAGIYAFSGEALEQLKTARTRGLWTAVEQMIAPRDVVDRLVSEEDAAFPDWQMPATDDPFAAAFIARERAEWALADIVICPSEFVRRHVIESGCPAARATVVPYGIDSRFIVARREREPGPLRILTAGEICLRKGSPYVLEAARRMRGRAIFRMVGPCTVLPQARAALEAVVELKGAVPRSEMLEQYAWADVFLLPSICEGSATAVYEALAAGLPVICTENTGSVVRHGTDGFIVPIRDAGAIVDALEQLMDPSLRRGMAANALARAAEFTLERYSERLLAVLSGVHRSEDIPSCAE